MSEHNLPPIPECDEKLNFLRTWKLKINLQELFEKSLRFAIVIIEDSAATPESSITNNKHSDALIFI